ncbi:MAG: universal stress protein [Deltaproteobacteria bacterium]|nr:universal stress protein [Deltaproteobacteria bacterium]MBW1924505.1 universal stress protein [Deltaproteobacteria bacterium]MBW1949665.1 universal stress protein [Deltaproteobacteria bacterium]MBW2008112.1 universal stress protein [Deltaproteobacteria bacterium]MBW2348478.1 universal stress protein [Deltaproteobacteria bacterium]
MAKKVLIALDDSVNAMRAVDFIATAFDKGSKVTLFSVIPDTAAMCEMTNPELTPYFLSQRDVFCSMEDKKRELVNGAVKEAKDRLMSAGFREEDIAVKMENQRKGVARDIVEEAREGYDVIVLGRRGLSGIKEFILGSVSQKVVHAVKDTSILLVS